MTKKYISITIVLLEIPFESYHFNQRGVHWAWDLFPAFAAFKTNDHLLHESMKNLHKVMGIFRAVRDPLKKTARFSFKKKVRRNRIPLLLEALLKHVNYATSTSSLWIGIYNLFTIYVKAEASQCLGSRFQVHQMHQMLGSHGLLHPAWKASLSIKTCQPKSTENPPSSRTRLKLLKLPVVSCEL